MDIQVLFSRTISKTSQQNKVPTIHGKSRRLILSGTFFTRLFLPVVAICAINAHANLLPSSLPLLNMPIEYSKHSDMPIPAHPESFSNNRTTTKKGRESILFAFYLGSAASIHSSRSFCIMTTYYYSVTGIASFVRIYISMAAPGFTNSRKNNCVVSKVRF